VRDAVLGLLILLAVASDSIILGRLRALWIRARGRREPPPTPAEVSGG
jgi:hypothetical protein